MGIRQTHTYAELGLTAPAYEEIKRKLKDAGYDHAFMEDGTIDMHGIGVTLEHNPVPSCECDVGMCTHRPNCRQK